MLSVLVGLVWLLSPWRGALQLGWAGRVGAAGDDAMAAGVGGLLERAVQVHASGGGSAEEVVGLYESVLAVQPGHVTALHNLAALHYSMGQHTTALELVGRAITAGHDSLTGSSTTTTAQHHLDAADHDKRHATAAANTTSSSSRVSELAAAYNTQGLVLRALGDMEGAYRSLQEALSLQPEQQPAAHVNLAELLVRHWPSCWPEAGNRRHQCVRAALQHYRLGLEQDAAAGRQGEEGGGSGGGGVLDRRTVLNDYALALLEVGEVGECLLRLQEALSLEPSSLQTRGNLAIAYKEAGLLREAMAQALAASQLAPSDPRLLYNLGLLHRQAADAALPGLQREREEQLAASSFERALQHDPSLHQALASLGHMAGDRGEVEAAAEYYRRAYRAALAKGERLEANSLRLQVATALVPHIYNSTQHMKTVTDRWLFNLRALLSLPDPPLLPDPLTSTGSGSLGYYLLYTGGPDLPLRRTLAQVYWRSCPVLRYTAPFLLQLPPPPPGRRRLRVGFLSAFFFHHSVGLLLQGVMTRLPRDRFEVVVLAVPPLPPSDDEVWRAISQGVERVVALPAGLGAAQEAVGGEELDVLVLGEVGMDALTYFLSFARLARRTALFWGHAVSSGVSAADQPHNNNNQAAMVGHGGGGVDWFVSSSLFETQDLAAQSKYSEALYLMNGLTTYFLPPPNTTTTTTGSSEAEEEEDALLSSLGLPVGGEGGRALYVLPQTLYKLHPDMDQMLRHLLLLDPQSVLVLPAAQRSEWGAQLLARLDASLGQETRERQVLLVRRLTHAEYQVLVRRASVVLDPFPVGGGRSSFEILAHGTPIVVLYPRTSILQLTTAMYRHMRLQPPHLSLLVTTSATRYVQAAHALAHNASLRAAVSHDILSKAHRLYRSQEAVQEWARFLTFIAESPRPDPRHPRPIASRDLPHTIPHTPNTQQQHQHQQQQHQQQQHQQQQHQPQRPPPPPPQQQQQAQEEEESWVWVRGGEWGWVAVPSSSSVGPGQQSTRGPSPPSHPDLLYALKITADLPPTTAAAAGQPPPEQGSFIIEVWRGGPSVSSVSASLCGFLQAEPIRCRYMELLLARGAGRHRGQEEGERQVAWRGRVEVTAPPSQQPQPAPSEEGEELWLDVLWGEEATAAVYWHAYRLGLDRQLRPQDMAQLLTGVKAALGGEDSSVAWLADRHERDRRARLAPSASSAPLPPTPAALCLARLPAPPPLLGGGSLGSLGHGGGGVTLALTTCRRLQHFRTTLSSLLQATGPLPNGLITRVLVVDDNSSPQDVSAMVSEFPFLTLIEGGRGHAASMNRLVRAVQTRYLLYLEDDWTTLQPHQRHDHDSTTSSSGPSSFLHHALAVLRASQRPHSGVEWLSQVLFNGQSSRDCAYSNFPQCLHDPLRNKGGWARVVNATDQDAGAEGSGGAARYNLHEFGAMEHDFGYWPGLSLNPGLWDLTLIKCALGQDEDTMMFDEQDPRFEQAWSLRGYDAGLRVAHLPRNVFEHAGGDVSAYVINNQHRPWDPPPAPAAAA